uniref:Uncharacterized protein n=1 Tax=Anguilla anguilla TaxID=7936 RepID=A0A0E9PJV2_ANGAN
MSHSVRLSNNSPPRSVFLQLPKSIKEYLVF